MNRRSGTTGNERLGTEFRKVFFAGVVMGGYGSGRLGGRPTVQCHQIETMRFRVGGEQTD